MCVRVYNIVMDVKCVHYFHFLLKLLRCLHAYKVLVFEAEVKN